MLIDGGAGNYLRLLHAHSLFIQPFLSLTLESLTMAQYHREWVNMQCGSRLSQCALGQYSEETLYVGGIHVTARVKERLSTQLLILPRFHFTTHVLSKQFINNIMTGLLLSPLNMFSSHLEI